MNETVLQVFCSAEELKDAFIGRVVVGLALVLIIAAVPAVKAMTRRHAGYLGITVSLVFAALIFDVWSSYSETYSRFIEVDAHGSSLRLRFAGSSAKDVIVSASSIDTVLFASLGKSDRECYVRVLLKSGESYRSAALNKEVAVCKQLRQDILRALRI